MVDLVTTAVLILAVKIQLVLMFVNVCLGTNDRISTTALKLMNVVQVSTNAMKMLTASTHLDRITAAAKRVTPEMAMNANVSILVSDLVIFASQCL